MRKLVTWTNDTEFGYSEQYEIRQTPERIADEMSRWLTAPRFLTGKDCFALGVWALR